MNSDFPTILFWGLAAAIVFLNLRWSILSYLLIAQIDMTVLAGLIDLSASRIGIENAAKVIVLPCILLWRIGWIRSRHSGWPLAAKIWAGLTIYSAVSTMWTPYRLSALKMTGYLCSYAALAIVFTSAWSRRWITERALVVVAWCSMGFAVIQTYLLDDVFGTILLGPNVRRFTTFSEPQGFAAFLISILALLLCGGSSKFWTRITEVGLVLCIILTGSRTTFVGTVLLFLGASVLKLARKAHKLEIKVILKRSLMGVLPGLLMVGFVAHYLPTNRISELLSSVTEREASVEDVGTLAWRLLIYHEAADELSHRQLSKLLVGSGTSSGWDVLLVAVGSEYGFLMDPNRAMHNEFLRSFYEWGVIGLSLLILFLVEVLRVSLRAFRTRRSWQAAAFLSILPAMLFSLAVEPVLAGAGGPGGTGYVLVLAALISSVLELLREGNAKCPARKAPRDGPA
jgi:hypothetical protein